MAGLESHFQSRVNQNGATANAFGGGQFPKGGFSSPLPAVSSNFNIKTRKLYANNSSTQVSPTKQPLGWATMLPSLGRTPTNTSRVSRQTTTASLVPESSGHPPQPNASLVARLSLASARSVLSPEKNSNTKSVERVRTNFRARFSGDNTEDWLQHVDRLETELARFYSWTPREFYFGLRATLTGKALATLRSMEEDMELSSFADLIPVWFEPTGEDWRKIYDGTAVFSTSTHRM